LVGEAKGYGQVQTLRARTRVGVGRLLKNSLFLSGLAAYGVSENAANWGEFRVAVVFFHVGML
jgi:hypothetical protein